MDKSILLKKFLIVVIALSLLSSCSNTGLGVATGGIIGGVAGSAITGGSTAGTIAGAVGGAYVGGQLSQPYYY